MSLFTLLDMIAGALPDRTAIQADGVDTSFDRMRTLACGAGWRASEAGVGHLVRLGTGGLADPVALFGAAAAAIPFVPLNYRLAPAELDALVDRLLPALLVVDEAFAERVAPREGLVVMTAPHFLAAAQSAERDAPAADAAPEDAAVLLFTSGTTGAPKAAVLRHQNLFAYIIGSVEFASAEADEVGLVAVPPYHIAGIAALLSAAYAGRTLVILGGFSPERWLEACAGHVVAHAFLVPTMLARIVATLTEANAPAPYVRAIAYGGGRMPEPVIRRAIALFGDTAFTNAYGLTETSSTIAVLTPDDHRAALAAPIGSEAARRLGSVGQPLPGVEIEVRDEAGRPAPAGTVGAIHVRGDQVSGEYREGGSLLDPQGWFDTRDHGYLDSGGYLHLEGRLDDVIVRGGENISPGEIERVLTAHPGVQDAAVVALPDEEWGEAVGAAIVLHPSTQVSEAEIRDWVRNALRSSRVPAHIRFETQLPYNEMGKLLRRVVRTTMLRDAAG